MRPKSVRGASIAVALAVSLAGAAASATSSKDEAKQHFDAANALVDNEDYAAAAAELELSVQLFPTKMGLFNLANCYKALNRYGDALEALARLEREFAGKLGTLSRDVSSLKNTIEGMVGRLAVKVDKDGAAIRVDGAEIGVSPLGKPLVLAPGDHVIEAKLSGYVDASQTVRIVSLETREVSFVLAEEPVAPPAPAPPPSAEAKPAPPPVVSGFDALLAQNGAAATQDEIWSQVERTARDDGFARVQRIAILRQFLVYYPQENPYVEYANLLIEMLERGLEPSDMEKTWVRVEAIVRDADVPPAHRVAALKQYVATLPSYPWLDSPHLEYAKLLIESLVTGDDPNDVPMDPEWLRNKTEWFSLRGEGGSYGGGGMISLFTVRWRWFYWEILRMAGGGGMPSRGDVRWWSLMGTAIGLPINFGKTQRHEFRIGLGLMGGMMHEYKYEKIDSSSLGDGNELATSLGPILEPEVSYVFHAARRFALQIGIGVYIATMVSDSNGERDTFVVPAPIWSSPDFVDT